MAICKWCRSGIMKKHSNPDKARQGLTTCVKCNMTHSPHGLPGSYAYWDGTRIVTGIRKDLITTKETSHVNLS